MTDAGRAYLAADNLQLLEVDAWSGVRVEDNKADNTCYATLDAALRLTWDLGGTVNASAVGCIVVVDAYGYVAPLAVAPCVYDGWSVQQLKLFVGGDPDMLGPGRNTDFYTVHAM